MSRVSRSEVIDRAWRALGSGVEPLTGPGGGPLSRTVKLVLVPLLIRPTINRDLAGAVLDASSARRLAELINEAAETLRATARWLVLLREFADQAAPDSPVETSRDALYPRAWEMAVTHGAPPTASDAQERMVRMVFADLHDGARSDGDVATALADPDLRGQLQQRLDASWHATTAATGTRSGASARRHAATAHSFLDAATPGRPGPELQENPTSKENPAHRQNPAPQGGSAHWRALLEGRYGTDTGRAVATNRWPARGPGQARLLGLTARDVPGQPELAEQPETRPATMWPWDRTVAQRVRGLLRYSREPDLLPSAADLLLAEAERAGAPWHVGSEPARLLLALGTHLSLGMHTSDEAGQRTPLPSDSTTHERLREMRRRESWLAWATRNPAAADGESLDHRAPYLRRLWVRVHGAETHQSLPESATDVLSLLIGVYRSVLLDGRSRVRADLARRQVGTS